MIGLLRSELRKVTGTRLALGLLLGALAIVSLALGFTLWGPEGAGVEVEGAARSLETADDVLALLGVTNVVWLFALIFGVTFATAEFRHHTASTTFLSEPRRWRVPLAKAVTASLVAVGYMVLVLAVAMVLLWGYALTEGLELPLDGEVWTFLGMSIVAGVVNAVMGVGIGTAIRSQVGAIVSVLVWLFVIESLVGGLLPSVSRWMPFAVGNALTVSDGDIAIGLAAVLAAGYAGLALAVGTALVERRDVA